MPVNRQLWRRRFEKHAIPDLPCPRCGTTLTPDGEPRIEETAYSKAMHTEDQWAPEDTVSRFTLHLTCEKKSCGEIVVMAGRADVEELHYEEEDGYSSEYHDMLRPATVYPPVPMFQLSERIPDPVARQLMLAFQLYWADLPTCLSRIRTSVELVLDDQGIASEKARRSGEMIPMNLSERIEIYKGQPGNEDHGESLDVLRVVGNLGTHETKVHPEALFDTLDLYEDVLGKIYIDNSIQAKRAKLLATKGRY